MRIALALVLVTVPALSLPLAAQAAQSGEDRYGPPAPQRAAPVSYPTPAEVAKDEAAVAGEAANYRGPYLNWASRSAPRRAAPTGQIVRPQGQAVQAAASTPPRAPQAPAPRAPAPMAPAPHYQARYAPAEPAPRPQALPQSLYSAPPASPAPVAQQSAPQAQRPFVQAAAQPAPMLPRRTMMTAEARAPAPQPTPAHPARAVEPQQARAAVSTQTPHPTLAAAAPPVSAAPAQPVPAPTQVAMAAPAPQPPAAPVKARFYSLHRDYGDAPDPVTLPASRPMVLVGPGETATAPQSGAQIGAEDENQDGRAAKPKPSAGILN